MKKIIILLFILSGLTYSQNKIVYTNDMMDSLSAFLADSVKPAISDSLDAVSIGNADSLGSFPASDYLTWSDTTSTLATQNDLSVLEASVNQDSITALRTDINTNISNIATNTTNISGLTTLANNKFYLGNGSNVATEVTLSGDVTSSNDGTMAIGSGVIVNADINASASIDATKIADGSVSSTEFQYLGSVTSDIQTQIDNLEVGTLSSLTDGTILIGDGANDPQERTLSGDITTSNTGVTAISSGVIVNADINASAGITATKIGGGTVDDTEFGYINGLTSAAQTQITTNAGNISTNTTNIGVNTDSITAHRVDINSNTSSIATNASNISTNTSNISGITTLANGKIYIGNGSNAATEVTPSGDATMTNTGVIALGAGVIVNNDVNASAAIDATKIHDGTISNTEYGYLNNLTGNIQTQITAENDSTTALRTSINTINTLADGKFYVGNSSNQATEVSMSGDILMANNGATTIQDDKIVDAMIYSAANIDASKLGTGVISNTEFNYLNGTTSAIQTQFDNLNVIDSVKARGSSIDWNLLSPQSSEELLLKNVKYDLTIDSVTAVLVGSSTPSVTFNIVHGGTNLFSSAQTANDYTNSTINVTSHDSYSTFNDAAISAGEFMHIEIGTVSGTVTQMLITIFYTED